MGCLFLSVFFIPKIASFGVVWMNYALCISTGLAIPLVLFTKEKYTRSDLDDPSDIGQASTFSTHPLDSDVNNEAVFSSSNVPYSVMQ